MAGGGHLPSMPFAGGPRGGWVHAEEGREAMGGTERVEEENGTAAGGHAHVSEERESEASVGVDDEEFPSDMH